MAAVGRKLVSLPDGPASLEQRSHAEQPSPTLVEAVHSDWVALWLVSPACGEPQSAGGLR